MYGSGFEAQPELLERLSARLPLIGNAAHVVGSLKSPASFFAALQQLGIRHPKVCSMLPDGDADAYLVKFAGGCGGTHISPACAGQQLMDSHYYQQKLSGRAVSLLFLADGHDIELVGFNEQWLNPSAKCPYRYGGAAGHAALAQDTGQQLVDAARKLTDAFGLLGLNSLDGIVEDDGAGTESVSVLELNPRLSATVDLYADTDVSWVGRHIQVCRREAGLEQAAVPQAPRQSKAHGIVYAVHDINLPSTVSWPAWVADMPGFDAGTKAVRAGEPVCSVFAYADSADEAKKMAQHRVELIQNLLQSLN